MPESAEQKVARLMAEGLDHYGQDRVDQAVACWRQVVALNPNHRVALDYLDAAGYAEPTKAAAPRVVAKAFLAEAAEMMARGRAGEALELVEKHIHEAPDSLDAQATIDLLRSHLYAEALERVGDGAGVPNVRLGPDQILRFKLAPSAGFVLSMIDGVTSIADLVPLTGMDPFDALQTLGRLQDAGIIEVRA